MPRYTLKDFPGSSHRILAGWLGGLAAGSRILELGPGAGYVKRLVERRDLHWVGLEGYLGYLGELRRSFSAAAIVDLEHLAVLPRGYDVVLAADTLEHLSAPDRILTIIHTALRPGGLLVLSVPNVANVYVRLQLLRGRFPYADRGILDRTHRYFFTRHSLSAMLRDAGFVPQRHAVSTIPLPLAWPRLPRSVLLVLDALLAPATRLLPGLMGYQVLVSAARA